MVVGRRLIGLLLVIALAVGGAFYWQNRRIEKSEMEAGLASSRVISAAFATKSELKVATLSGEVLAQAKGCSLNCWVTNGQETRAPYSVDYFVALTGFDASAFRWNAKDQIMSVDIPDLTVAAPNIDMSRAKTKQEGLWISRDSGIAMQAQAAGYLFTGARTKAESPENLARARESARQSIAKFLEAPLAAAGFSNIQVAVRFPGDARPAGLSSEQWDVSRSIADVLANRY